MTKTKSKFLEYFLDKPIVVIYKRPTEHGEAMTGTLIDMDDEHYYVGGDNQALFAIAKHAVRAIADATDAVEAFNEDEGNLH